RRRSRRAVPRLCPAWGISTHRSALSAGRLGIMHMLCHRAPVHPRHEPRGRSAPCQLMRELQLGPLAQRLEDNAITLGELHQRLQLVGAGIAVELEAQADLAEAHRGVLVDPERAAEIEIALGPHPAAAQRHLERRRHRLERDPAQATSASSSMSPEQSAMPSPPVAGWSPASAIARPVSTLQVMLSAPSAPSALRVITAFSGTSR